MKKSVENKKRTAGVSELEAGGGKDISGGRSMLVEEDALVRDEQLVRRGVLRGEGIFNTKKRMGRSLHSDSGISVFDSEESLIPHS